MQRTDIEWTHLSANPLKYRSKSDGKAVWGCVKTSPGCAHCYSEQIALRWQRGKLFNARNMDELEPFLDEAELHEMLTRKTCGGIKVSGLRCFVGDMTDLFGEWVPDDLLNRLFSGVLELRTDVTWQLLTKRADRMKRYLSWRWGEGRIPCRHIHCGVSVEDQKRKDRIDVLRQVPVAVRFLSLEPLLEDLGELNLDGIHWVIAGGESGPNARPCNMAWNRSIIRQCGAADVPVFIKQLGSNVVADLGKGGWPDKNNKPLVGRFCSGTTGLEHFKLRDRAGADPSEWPQDLRIREYPT